MNTNIYSGVEKNKQFKIQILGTPKSGQTALMYSVMRNYQSYAPVPNIYGPYSYDIVVKNASAELRATLTDNNERSYDSKTL